MLDYDFIGIIAYSIGLILWFPLWHFLVGYPVLGRMKLLYLPFLAAPFVFISNIILCFFATVNEFEVELKIYPYVEENAKVVAALSLAIAIFAVIEIKENVRQLTPRTKLFLWLIFWSFLISVLGVLPLYWAPTDKYWLTALRHIKSLPLFYSLFILGAGIIVFMYEIGYKRGVINEIENTKIFE